MSSTKCRNTASTQSTSGKGSLNTSITESIPEYRTPKYSKYSSIPEYRTPKYFKYSSIPEYRTTKYLKYKQYPEYSTPKYLKFKQYLEYWPPKYLEVQAVSTRVLGPEILGVQAESSVCSIGPQNTASTGRIKSMKPTESQNAQYKHNLLASKPGVPAELPSLLLQLLLFYSEYYLS